MWGADMSRAWTLFKNLLAWGFVAYVLGTYAYAGLLTGAVGVPLVLVTLGIFLAYKTR